MPQLNISTLVILSIFLIGPVIAQDSMTTGYPFYDEENKILMIPRVDTSEKAGAYHGATFFFNEQTNSWHLMGVNVAHEGDMSIDEVTATVTDTFPTQVFLRITGDKFVCRELTLPDQKLEGNIFEIRIYTYIADPAFIGATCKVDRESFVRVIPLSVYGLVAGTYEYNVNGKFNGMFNLLENNKFSE